MVDPNSGHNQEGGRRTEPSPWLELTGNQTLPKVVDALLDAPPGKEFNKKELGDFAGVSRESIRAYIDVLVGFGIMEEVPDSSPTRYRLNDRGKVTVELFELNSALNSVASGEAKIISQQDDHIFRLPIDVGESSDIRQSHIDFQIDNSERSSEGGANLDSLRRTSNAV